MKSKAPSFSVRPSDYQALAKIRGKIPIQTIINYAIHSFVEAVAPDTQAKANHRTKLELAFDPATKKLIRL